MTHKLLCVLIVAAHWMVISDASAVSMLPPSRATLTENHYLEMYNRTIHGFNQWLFTWLTPTDKATDTIASIIPSPIKVGTFNFMSNLINEPLTIAASLLEGDQLNALNAATRFILNTTVGFGGILDIAGYIGYVSNYRDLGLAMCKYGVPSGPHIVVPLVGPRTLRDGTADVVLVNVLYLTVLASFFGAAPNVNVIIGIILMETVGDLVLVRQIDSPEINEMNDPYEIVRDRYLHAREIKCQSIIER